MEIRGLFVVIHVQNKLTAMMDFLNTNCRKLPTNDHK